MKNTQNLPRRKFLINSTIGAVGVSLGMPAKSYARIIGSNERTNVAIIGCNRRFPGLSEPLSSFKDVNIIYVCDVDAQRQNKGQEKVSIDAGYTPKVEKDYRKIIAEKDIDAVFLATPDHWHAPGTWMALEAGKHVYVEKPCSHNPRESELLMAFQKKYGKIVQMGNQQRSAPESQELVAMVRNGEIGEVYHALAFYSNSRGRVPNGKKVPVPDYLDWDLFQGPAPRTEFMDILGDYMWHWYWNWGTGETGNNATHELDFARWALDVKYPEKVKMNSGKHHFIDDGWTMYDTMYATFEFENGKTISWDGKSRSGHNTYGADRGTILYGSEGSAFVNRDGYKMYDRSGKLIKEREAEFSEGGINLGGGGGMTVLHVRNFIDAVQGKADQNSNIIDGAISTNLCHYANISSRLGDQTLEINTENGRFKDPEIMNQYWSRSYEQGWEPPSL